MSPRWVISSFDNCPTVLDKAVPQVISLKKEQEGASSPPMTNKSVCELWMGSKGQDFEKDQFIPVVRSSLSVFTVLPKPEAGAAAS